ncbi:Trafficking protein particle complex 8, partial [Perkinsus olseni]
AGPRRAVLVPIRCLVTNLSPTYTILLDRSGPLDVYPSSALGALQVEEALPIPEGQGTLGPGRSLQMIYWVTIGGEYSSAASEGGDFLLNEAKTAQDMSTNRRTKTLGDLGLPLQAPAKKGISKAASEHYHIVLNWRLDNAEDRCGQSFCPHVTLLHAGRPKTECEQPSSPRKSPLDSNTLKALTALV